MKEDVFWELHNKRNLSRILLALTIVLRPEAVFFLTCRTGSIDILFQQLINVNCCFEFYHIGKHKNFPLPTSN